ncbi:MAG: acyltransferase [Candidatus Omnitrophica bacterium]|nr:acyltransferase [Candidatus Omnitrophota bacterium]
MIAFAKGYMVKLRHIFNHKVKIGKKFKVFKGFKIEGGGVVTIGDNVEVHDFSRIIVAKNKAKVVIGNNVILNNCTFYSWDSITVGDFCLLVGGYSDTDSHSISIDRRTNPNAIVNVSPIIIEENVWVGTNSIILKGVKIGRNSVVGAGSVVTRDIPENCVVAGNPAKVIKHIK